MLKGNLSGFSLGEILQSLAINRHTGTLAVAAPDGTRKHIFFEKGEIRLFSHGTAAALRIGEVLLRQGKLRPDELKHALKQQSKSHALLGSILAAEGLVTSEDIADAIRIKVQEEMYDLFLWKEGDFEFELDKCPENIFDPLQKEAGLRINPNSVIMEGLRRLDEWEVISSWIRTEDEIYTRAAARSGDAEETAEAEVFRLVDGELTVREITREFSGTRFECAKALYNLLESKALRSLTIDELQALASQAESKKVLSRAAAALRYAAQLCPEEASIHIRLAEVLERQNLSSEAHQAYLAALRLYSDQDEWDNAAKVAERFAAGAEFERRDLHVLFNTFVATRDIKRALWSGNQLSSVLEAAGETAKAAEILDSLARLDPSDLNLRLNVAALLVKAGDDQRAIRYYEEVARSLEQQKKLKDQIKVLRIVADLDPKRGDIRQRIGTLVALQERLEQRRKRRLTAAGISTIAALLCTVLPLLYEIKARELFTHATRMEEISLSSGDFGRCRRAYEDLISRYSWSTKVDEAQIALERVAQIERHFIDSRRILEQQRERERLEQLRKKEAEFSALLEEAKGKEQEGDVEAAHALLTKALAMGEPFIRSRKVLLPVKITTSPSGATVMNRGTTLGTTPLVLHYERGAQMSLEFSLKGCQRHVENLTLDTQHSLHIALERRPTWEYTFDSTFGQDLHWAGAYLVFLSRNGFLYAYDFEKQEPAWERKVGLFGDRVSDLRVSGGRIYTGTVSGELLAIDVESGELLWTALAVPGPVYAAPGVSEDGQLVAMATLHGEVALFSAERGEFRAKFATENEAVSSPLFHQGTLIAGSTDSHVYGYSVDEKRVLFVREVSSSVTVDPIAAGDLVVIATDDGRVHVLDPRLGEVVWSAAVTSGGVVGLVAAGREVLVAARAGKVVPVDPSSRRIGTALSTGGTGLGGIQIDEQRLYATHESGLLSVLDLDRRQPAWTWSAGKPVRVPPLVAGGRVLVASASGKVEVLEILE